MSSGTPNAATSPSASAASPAPTLQPSKSSLLLQRSAAELQATLPDGERLSSLFPEGAMAATASTSVSAAGATTPVVKRTRPPLEADDVPLTPQFHTALENYFPGAVELPAWSDAVVAALAPHGLAPDNALACLSVCRDELVRRFVKHINEVWGSPFNFGGLAGLPAGGKMGFKAAMSHGPCRDGVERYVFFALTHVAIDNEGRLGPSQRVGRSDICNACGALAAFGNELAQNHLSLGLDLMDVEYSFLKQRIASRLRYGHVPSLHDLTLVTLDTIIHDLQELINYIVVHKPAKSVSYAVVTGVQVHAPGNTEFIWPGIAYVVSKDGERTSVLASLQHDTQEASLLAASGRTTSPATAAPSAAAAAGH